MEEIKKNTLHYEDDGFVVLVGMSSSISPLQEKSDGMKDSTCMDASNSSLPEKQISEGSEKNSHDDNISEDFTSRLVDHQQEMINKCSYSSYGSDEEDAKEKSEKGSTEKPHVQDLPFSPKEAVEDVGEGSRDGKHQQPKMDDVPENKDVAVSTTSSLTNNGVPVHQIDHSLDEVTRDGKDQQPKMDDVPENKDVAVSTTSSLTNNGVPVHQIDHSLGEVTRDGKDQQPKRDDVQRSEDIESRSTSGLTNSGVPVHQIDHSLDEVTRDGEDQQPKMDDVPENKDVAVSTTSSLTNTGVPVHQIDHSLDEVSSDGKDQQPKMDDVLPENKDVAVSTTSSRTNSGVPVHQIDHSLDEVTRDGKDQQPKMDDVPENKDVAVSTTSSRTNSGVPVHQIDHSLDELSSDGKDQQPKMDDVPENKDVAVSTTSSRTNSGVPVHQIDHSLDEVSSDGKDQQPKGNDVPENKDVAVSTTSSLTNSGVPVHQIDHSLDEVSSDGKDQQPKMDDVLENKDVAVSTTSSITNSGVPVHQIDHSLDEVTRDGKDQQPKMDDVPENKDVAVSTTGTSSLIKMDKPGNQEVALNQGRSEANFIPDTQSSAGLRHRPHPSPARRPRNEDMSQDQPKEMEMPTALASKSRCSYCNVVIFIIIGLAFLVNFFPPSLPLIYKPIVEINTEKHVSPKSASWQLKGNCRGYNSTHTITQCYWKQIHPKPTNPKNTLFPDGTQDCLHGNPSYHIDATLSSLRVPEELGNYIFELHCTDDTGNTKDERVDVWINMLHPPIVKIDKENIMMSTSVGSTQLNASCLAVQGKIESERWEFVEGPKELDHPGADGIVQIDVPGKYEFKYKCLDSYGGFESAKVNVTAKPPYVLGIDLGTSTTCIVVIKEDGTTKDINIFHDVHDTDSCMPSVVAFGENGKLLIGEEALRQAVTNPLATIYEIKRLMGRSYYDDPNHKFSYRVRPTLASHSFKGVRAAIEIPCNGGKKLLQPELVSALILRRVVDIAEERLGVPIKDVVISVPAQFDDAQRKATMDASRIAGLSPRKIVNEPTVAAFAARNVMDDWLIAADTQDSDTKKDKGTVWAVVADIGGGTTDYALMQIDSDRNVYKVISTDGNKTLGGRDIDIALAKKLTEILQNKNTALDLKSIGFQQKLRIECENAKIALSKNQQYSMTFAYSDAKHGEVRLKHLLTRNAFEDYISGILKSMVAPLDSLLARAAGVDGSVKANINRGSIEDLYLVGGTSNIPKLKEKLQRYFNKAKRILHKDPIQLVSRGAAVFGAALTHLVEVQNMPEIDVTPLPINIAVDMDDMYEIFSRNTIYPTFTKKKITTFANEQTSIVVKVYEGEGRTANENHFLGELELSGIPPQPKRIPEIETLYQIDTNGILSVIASFEGKETKKDLAVYTKSGSMLEKRKEKLSLLLTQLMKHESSGYQSTCSLLETATEMKEIPQKPEKENVLKLSVDSEYDSVEMKSQQSRPTEGMIAIKGLVAGSEIATKEVDVDIVLVIDKSGSMLGIAIETIQKVILGLVDVLKGNHRLGIVSYDTSIQTRLELTYCTDELKNTARNIVSGINAQGGTNLYGGLLQGLQMAYRGHRRSRVLLFTDGRANVGWVYPNDIIREIVKETKNLKSSTAAEVQLSTFGYFYDHDEELLRSLAVNIGGGTYNYLDENTSMVEGFGTVVGDAINTIAEKIQLTVTPLDGVQIMKMTTDFCKKDQEKMTCEIPSLADQHSIHILIQLNVPPCDEYKVHDVLFHVDLNYFNTITNRGEGSEERLFVARTPRLDKETRSREVDEQLNRIFVAEKIAKALEYLNNNNINKKEETTRILKEADEFILASSSKDSTLTLCLHRDLLHLISSVGGSEATKVLQDSLTSHLQEKGGRGTCYLTKKEDKLISILKNN